MTPMTMWYGGAMKPYKPIPARDILRIMKRIELPYLRWLKTLNR